MLSGVEAQPALEQGIAVEGGELAEDACGGCEAHGMALQHGAAGDICGDCGLSDAVGSDQDEIGCLLEEVECHEVLDGHAVASSGPVPVEVGEGLELSEAGVGEASFEASAAPLFFLPVDQGGQPSGPDRRQAILADPRDLHRELFAGFTPTGYPECAGTYRGTPDTALADIRMSAPSQIDPDVVYEFCPPREVPWLMTELRLNTRSLLYEPDQEDYDKLIALAYTFCRFGKIHPFLDGNGHVQRAVFAVMATEFDFPLSPRFVIHPRPFDRLLAAALEMFGRASADEEQEELGLVAEYLAFFLDGPFNAPRKHVGMASLYTS